MAEPPFVDEHETTIAAGPEEVWSALGATLDGAFASRTARAYARLIRCEPRMAGGPRPFAAGSTVPGFEAVHAVPGVELVLRGGHRFSRYSLTFRCASLDDGTTRLRAETRAAFPGLAGAAYRAAVIGTGAHRIGVRRLLAGVRDRCSAPPRSVA